MQPTLCSRCKKNVAVIFITRIENGESHNEGLCLRCARELHIKPVDEMMEKLGISDADLDNLTGDVAEMLGSMGMLGGDADTDSDAPDTDADEDDGKTATFPFLNRLFNQNPPSAPDAETPEQPRQDAAAADKRGSAPRKLKFLTNYCIDLTQRARDGKLDAMIGRAEELERVIQILNRRQKNNPCLIGEPGVGKTAIAEGLAQRIAEGNVPYKLRDKQVYLLDLTALVAGTQFRGQFESRMKGLIEEIRRVGNIILVIDEVHNIVGAGDAEGSMNAANILKPALSRGEIQVIGATTFTEYRKHIEKDTALERRFQPVTVNEPNMEDTLKILKGIAHYYEQFHGVKIPEGILRQAVLLSERYITDRFLPDKAIDLVDEACAMIRTEMDSMPTELDVINRKIIQMQIDPQKIGDVVGQRGKTINAIIEETGVKIDIDDDGNVSICGTEKENMEKAAKYIHTIVTDYEAGQLFEGKVVSIKEFGAFVEFAPGKEGMVHISKLSKNRVEKVEDVVSLGDVVKVVCLGKDKMGRFSFSMKDVAE